MLPAISVTYTYRNELHYSSNHLLTGSIFFPQLHWNMIRLEGAEVLCNSLRTNRVLTNLDLSYNALGNAAGVLGAALIENNVSIYTILLLFDKYVFEPDVHIILSTFYGVVVRVFSCPSNHL